MGDTDREVVPSTLPTPLLMLRVVGAPPDRLQDSVEDWPEVIEPGVAVKELITGAFTTGGAWVAVTVADWVTVPPLFEAVRI